MNKSGFGLVCLTLLIWPLLTSVNASTKAKYQHDDFSVQSTPEGLSDAEWASIRRQITDSQYSPQEFHGGYVATNAAHDWQIQFGSDGFTEVVSRNATHPYSIGLKLITQKPCPSGPERIEAVGNTITYQWSNNLREWWVNDNGGLEQWFEIQKRPADLPENSELAIQLEIESSLPVRLDQNRLVFSDETTTITYDKLVAWDAEGAVLPSQMTLTDNRLKLLVNDTNARYPITIDPTVSQQAYLKASNTGSNDRFGFGAAISGDTVVVSAWREASNATGVNGDQTNNSVFGAGAAYVFVRSGNTWAQQAYLKPGAVQSFSDEFGYRIAIDGDTIVIGARNEDSSAVGVNGDQTSNSSSNSGAAFVFTRSGTTWSQQAYLKASNTGGGDQFGIGVAISGDTIVVGANMEDSNAVGVNGNQANNSSGNSGAAYVFTRSGTTWTQQAYLKASNTGSGDRFGEFVAIDNDTIVIGAATEDSSAVGINGNQADNSASDSGAAYVFVRSGTTWSQQAYVKASNTDSGDAFGITLSVEENTLIVGAYTEDSSATGVNGDQSSNSTSNSGAVYAFRRTGSTWAQEAYLKASNPAFSYWFGVTVDLDGEWAIIGASGESSSATGINGDQTDTSAPGSGAAYLFKRTGSSWSQEAYVKASNTGGGDSFGFVVNADSGSFVIGAVDEGSNATGVDGDQTNNSASQSGSAYVFSISPPRRIIVTGN